MDLATDFCNEVSSPTQPSLLAFTLTINQSEHLVENEWLCQQVLEATETTNTTNERANAAIERANATTKIVNLTNQRTTLLEDTIKLVQQQLVMMIIT